MTADRQLAQLETVFKALADGTRLRILGLLAAGEICVCDIHDSLGLPQPTVSRHLAYLRKSGLVGWRKDGLWVHYRLARLPDPILRAVLEAVRRALGRVETGARDRRRFARLVERRPAPRSAGHCRC